LRQGLVAPSFIPDRAQRELRDLTRYRMSLVDERSAEVNRLHKVLEAANLKVAGSATDILGKSGRQLRDLLVAGEPDAAVLAQCARGRMKEKIPLLDAALAGTVGEHHRFVLALQLAHSDALDATLDALSGRIAQQLAPCAAEVAVLATIPGLGRQTAAARLAEIGTALSQFPSAAHLASWAGRCPGNHESAGKRKGGKTRKGSRWLRTSLVVAAQAAGRSKHTALGARYRALAARRGSKRAAVAVGHSILLLAYHLLTRHEPYDDQRQVPRPPRPKSPDQLVQQLQALGYDVCIRPLEPAA